MNGYRFVNVSELDEEGLMKLAVLHHSVMHTLLSDLGFPIVLKYYQVARSVPSMIGIGALNPASEILGWAIGSPDPGVLNAKLRKPLPWFMMQMIKVGITHPLVFMQLISSVLSSSSDMELSVGAIELTYIGVSPTYQGMGLGRTLLSEFIELSRGKGYHSVVLSVEEENRSAVALYEKFGFQVIKTFTEGRYQRHRMELNI